MTDILNFVPAGFTLRDVQKTALLDIQEAWSRADVIVVPGPVAFGKSLVASTVALWQQAAGKSTGILTSQVILQNQYESTPPYFPSLKGRGRYECHDGVSTCEDQGDSVIGYCPECPYVAAKARALESNIAVFNFHSYLFNRAYKDNLFVDEAHTIMSMISEFYTIKIWKHIHPYPQLNNKAEVAIWLESKQKELNRKLEDLLNMGLSIDRSKVLELQRFLKKLRLVYEAIDLNPSDFFVEQGRDKYRGVARDVLKIKPLNIKNLDHGLWPHGKVQKILLSSATIRDHDVAELGLHRRRVVELECDSPITPAKRPFKFVPVANMGFKYQSKNIPVMAQHLRDLANKHLETKGIIHMPYALSKKFKPLLKGPRWMWHTQESKARQLQKFIDHPSPVILVACGMDQGIHLAGLEFQWQAIVKVQWPSLADAMVKSQSKERPKWYVWQAVRIVQQQYGRICRTPNDYGITYMLDIGFRSIDPKEKKHLDLWPKWFLEARK